MQDEEILAEKEDKFTQAYSRPVPARTPVLTGTDFMGLGG
jgi:hypothetical protein